MRLLTPFHLLGLVNVGLSLAIRPSIPISSLRASLQAINRTHIKISIENEYEEDTSMLTKHGIRTTKRIQNTALTVTHHFNGTEVQLLPGTVLRISFIESDSVKIPTADETLRSSDDGEYKVILNLTTPAILHTNGKTIEEALLNRIP